MKYINFLFFTLLYANFLKAASTEYDSNRKNLIVQDAYTDNRGLILLKFKYQDPGGDTPNPKFLGNYNFMCTPIKCYQLETRGDSIQTDRNGKIVDMNTRIEMGDGQLGVWKIDKEKNIANLSCPSSKRNLQQLSQSEIDQLTTDLHSGKIPAISLPSEAKTPKYYYEDANKNIIYIDRNKYTLPGVYRYFEGTKEDLKEVKITESSELVPGNVNLTLEDGRTVSAGRFVSTIKRNDQIFKAKDISSIEVSKMSVLNPKLYNFPLNNPCSETIDESISAITKKDFSSASSENSKTINDSSKSLVKPTIIEKDNSVLLPSTISK